MNCVNVYQRVALSIIFKAEHIGVHIVSSRGREEYQSVFDITLCAFLIRGSGEGDRMTMVLSSEEIALSESA